jgi:arginase
MEWETSFEANENIDTLRPSSDADIQGLKKPRFVSSVTKRVAEQVSTAAKAGDFVVTLGGDHSLAMGTVSGVFEAYPDACLIWIDAHAVSLSSFFGGGAQCGFSRHYFPCH